MRDGPGGIAHAAWQWRGIIALLLVLAVLGHDVLMASGANATHRDMRPDASGNVSQDQVPWSFRADDCYSVRPLSQQESNSCADPCPNCGGVVHGAVFLTMRTGTGHSRRNAPVAPPGVRRALLQVFLM